MSELQSQTTPLDDSMLELLYDEVPGAERADSEAAISAVFDKRERLESMRQLRGVLRETAAATDVEPAMAGMDALMAAARAQVADKVVQRADQARAVAATEREIDEGGFFARVMRWLKHPAMATMALAAIVGVVFSIARLRGRSDEVQLTAPAVQATQSITPKLDETGSSVGARDQAMPPPPASAPAAAATPAPATQEIRGEYMTNLPSQGDSKKSGPAPTHASKAAQVAPSDKTITQGAAAPKSYQASLDEEVGGGNRAAPAAAAEQAEAPPQGSVAPVAAAKPSPPSPTVEELTAQARAAAKDGKCATVTAIAARVRAMNSSYFRRSFVVDPDIAHCLATGN